MVECGRVAAKIHFLCRCNPREKNKLEAAEDEVADIPSFLIFSFFEDGGWCG